MNKYIFLDFDGVITTLKSRYNLDKSKCDLIQRIIDKTGAKIVVTSSWRYSTVEETKSSLTKIDDRVTFTPRWVDDIVGVTIRAFQYLDKSKIHLDTPRGVEIKQWIDTHIHSDNGHNYLYKQVGKDFEYIILDDDSDMLLEHSNHFIKTDAYEGITEDQVELAIKILNHE